MSIGAIGQNVLGDFEMNFHPFSMKFHPFEMRIGYIMDLN